jgi:SAM-dependent methyltransferase
MAGEHILEVGSGSGRFTEVCLQTGATVVSVEYSHAVEANHAQNGDDPNVLIVQADLFALPVRRGFFDRLYCFGVLQHTPSPRGAFQVLPRHVRDGGELAVDVYKANRLGRYLSFTPAPPTKYPVRLVTTRLPPEKLYRAVETYITTMWPLAGLVHRIPKIGRMLNWMALVPDHFNLGLDDATAREWAILNCYDMLSPRYDNPQHISEVRSWFDAPMFRDASVTYGHNGIVGKARVAARPRPVPDNHPSVPSEKEA